MLKEVIVSQSSLCTGCRACEVACGFHRTMRMDPSRSSIEIEKDETVGKFHIHLLESCDVCPDLEVPACIEICDVRALSLGRKFAQCELGDKE